MTMIPPAEGERRAVSGYSHQYRIAASIILEHLIERTLQWIRITDPEAGRVDDLQIGTQARVDAYQIKSSEYPGAFTFSNLTTKFKKSPSIIRQLVDGWQLLNKNYPGSRIVVHLVTNNLPSSNDTMPVGSPPPTPRHLSAFFQQAWLPRKQKKAIPSNLWDTTWEILRKYTGLEPEDFNQFIDDCELDFNYNTPEDDTGFGKNRVHEIKELAQFLFDAVANPQRNVQLTTDELLKRLGWQYNVEFVNPHDFPIYEPYEPIAETIQELEQKLGKSLGGYLFVHGSPGSGKSSLLTQFLRTRLGDRVICYYAFVPDSQDPRNLRGETENFLRDITLMLDRTGVGGKRSSFGSYTRDEMQKRLHAQIACLGEEWKKTHQKTIILIDGLDHIEREQHPERSLLNDLPDPAQIPDGVYMILGSQTDALQCLPQGVKRSIKKQDRRVEMRPLSRESVYRLTEKSVFKVPLTLDKKARLFDLSAGHPLALSYLLNRLSSSNDEAEQRSILDSERTFAGVIEDIYDAQWELIKNDNRLTSLLSKISRLRRAIDLRWSATWSDKDVVNQLYEHFGHYFRKEENDRRWYFFHNSFRLFVQQKTSERFGNHDEIMENEIHRELAKICSKESESSPWSWEIIYHLFQAEAHEEVIKCATQSWFRNQFFNLRPLDAIETDIKLALRSAAQLQDPVVLTRLSLAKAEIDMRYNHLEDISFVPLLLDLDQSDIAFEYTRDGNRLRIKESEVLDISLSLLNHGFEDEARYTFELAEPLDILNSRIAIEFHKVDEAYKLLSAWARSSIKFRCISEIITSIRRISRKLADHENPNTNHHFHNQIIFEVGRALIEEHDWENLGNLLSTFEKEISDDLECWFWLNVHAWRECINIEDMPKAQEFFTRVCDGISPENLDNHSKLVLAEGFYSIAGDLDQASIIVRSLPQPKLHDGLSGYNAGFRPFDYRFRLNRLLTAIDFYTKPSEIVPDASKPSEQGMVYFERAVCTVARIWGHKWSGKEYYIDSILSDARDIIRVFYRSFEEERKWLTWHIAREARIELYRLLIDAIAEYGIEVLRKLQICFQEEWSKPELSDVWPVKIIRDVIIAFVNNGIAKDWAAEWLNLITAKISKILNHEQQVNEYYKQAMAWFQIGDKGRALSSLQQLLQASSGIGTRKDYQMSNWVRWLKKANKSMPRQSAERINWFSKMVVALGAITGGSVQHNASSELVNATYDWRPLESIKLFKWLIEHESISYEDGLDNLIISAIKNPIVPSTIIISSLNNTLIPISRNSHPKILDELIKRISKQSGKSEAKQTAFQMLYTIDRFALPSIRNDWRRSVVDALQELGVDVQEIGLTEENTQSADHDLSGTIELKLKDGTRLNEKTIRARITNMKSLKALIDQASDESFYHWGEILHDFIRTLSIVDIKELDKILRTSDMRVSFVLAAVSERLSVLGERTTAWLFGEEALNRSNDYGWSRRYDGGTRLASFQALLKADIIPARELMYQILAQDGGGGVENLDEILPLLVDDIPIENIWLEIEEHVRELFSGIELSPENPSLSSDNEEKVAGQAFTDLICWQAHHLVTVLAELGKRAIADLLAVRNPAIIFKVSDLLNGDESEQQSMLAVIESVAWADKEMAMPFLERIADLRNSPNYGIKRSAIALCTRLGQYYPSSSGIVAQLPPIYDMSIVLKKGRFIIPFDTHLSTPLLAAGDPFKMLSPLDHQLKFISFETGIPLNNLVFRTLQLMRELEPASEWNIDAEMKINSQLRSMELRMPYNKPRCVVATRAIFHLIAELIDAGRIDSGSLNRLDPILRFYDPTAYLIQPEKRPPFVGPINRLSKYSIDEEQWLSSVSTLRENSYGFKHGEMIVLAEYTTLAILEQKKPYELRLMTVVSSCEPEVQLKKDPADFFNRCNNEYMNSYEEILPEDNDSCIIINNFLLGADSHCCNWLTVNPMLTKELGWHLSSEGLFRWLDAKENLMVESLYWIDGLIDHAPPLLGNEVGDGWLVLASSTACQQMSDHLGHINRRLYSARFFESRFHFNDGTSDYQQTPFRI